MSIVVEHGSVAFGDTAEFADHLAITFQIHLLHCCPLGKDFPIGNDSHCARIVLPLSPVFS